MSSNLPPGCGPLPGEDVASQYAETMCDEIGALILKHLPVEDDERVDKLVDELFEIVGRETRAAVKDYVNECKLWEEQQKAEELAQDYWRGQ